MVAQHTSREYELELREVRQRLLTMGGRAEQRLSQAMRALDRRDDALCCEVIEADDEIDRDEVEIDHMAQRILATRQPVAGDLRFIVMALKFVTDLERIGDLAANIAKRARELNRLPSAQIVDFGKLASQVQLSLRNALDSLAHDDADKATEVIERDKEIDKLNAAVFSELIARLASEPTLGNRVIPLTSVARSLERIGDHAKNLAEEVVFMVRGRDVRHGSGRER